MRMLPNGEAILLQIAHPGQRGLGSHAEEEPADVRMEETFRNVVRVVVVVGKLMMPSMVSAPAERGTFKGSRTEKEREGLHGPPRLEGQVGKKPVIAKRNAQPGRGGKENKEADLKGVQPEMPDIGGDRDESGQKRSDQKRAI